LSYNETKKKYAGYLIAINMMQNFLSLFFFISLSLFMKQEEEEGEEKFFMASILQFSN